MTHADSGWQTVSAADPGAEAPVLRARSGDRDAFGELVERHWNEMVALARTTLAGDTEAEDLVQEAFVQAWQRLGSLRRPESFPAWLRRIVVRRCLRWARRNRPRQEIPETMALGPGEEALDRLDIARLLAALAPRQRAVIHLMEVEGWTPGETARILGARIEGQVVLDLTVGAAGNVDDVTVVERLSHGLTESAVAAVRQWKFEPSEAAGGKSVVVRITLRFALPAA